MVIDALVADPGDDFDDEDDEEVVTAAASEERCGSRAQVLRRANHVAMLCSTKRNISCWMKKVSPFGFKTND